MGCEQGWALGITEVSQSYYNKQISEKKKVSQKRSGFSSGNPYLKILWYSLLPSPPFLPSPFFFPPLPEICPVEKGDSLTYMTVSWTVKHSGSCIPLPRVPINSSVTKAKEVIWRLARDPKRWAAGTTNTLSIAPTHHALQRWLSWVCCRCHQHIEHCNGGCLGCPAGTTNTLRTATAVVLNALQAQPTR